MFIVFAILCLAPIIVLLFLKKHDTVSKYLILLICFLPILLEKIYLPLAHTSFTFINIAIVLLFAFYMVKYSLFNAKIIYQVIGSIILFILYVSILAKWRGHDLYSHLYFFRNFYFNLLLFSILISVKKRSLDFDIDKFIFVILGVQVVLALLQYNFASFSDFFKVTEVLRDGQRVQRLSEEFFDAKVITGTFWAMANYGNVISLLVVYFLGQLLLPTKNQSLKLKRDWIGYLFVILGIVSVLLTGIRASAVSLLFGIGVLLWIRKKSLFFTALGGSIFAYFSYSAVLRQLTKSAASREVSIESPLERLTGIFTLFEGTSSPDDYLTLGRSIKLIDDFLKSPLLGAGNNNLFSGKYDSITDAFLALMVTDIGLIGLVLIFLPYYFVLKALHKYLPKEVFKIMFIIFVMLCMQTIVDEGLFYLVANFLFLILSVYNIRKYKYHHFSFSNLS